MLMGQDWEKVQDEAIQILSGYLKVDTTNPPGKELAGARYLAKILEGEGLAPIILESQPGRGNVISRMKGKEELSHQVPHQQDLFHVLFYKAFQNPSRTPGMI